MTAKLFSIRNIIVTLSFLGALIGIAVYFGNFSFSLTNPKSLEGKPAPEISYQTPSGEDASVKKSKGQAILLNFWASWCDPCMAELPTLRALENHFSGRGFLLLAFNLDDHPDKVQGKIQGKTKPRNLIFNFDRAAIRSYGINQLPLSVLINHEGVVQQVYVGPRDWTDMSILKEISASLRPY